jgi:hypothetical protein
MKHVLRSQRTVSMVRKTSDCLSAIMCLRGSKINGIGAADRQPPEFDAEWFAALISRVSKASVPRNEGFGCLLPPGDCGTPVVPRPFSSFR